MARKIKEIVETPVEEITEVPIEEVVVEPKKATRKTSKKISVKITSPRVNIRKEATIESKVLGIASNGDKFDLVSDENEKFYEINYDGKLAFVMKDFSTLA